MENDGAGAQMAKIQEEKSALRKQLIALVILSFIVSGLFYGITLAQNPYAKSDWVPQWAKRPNRWRVDVRRVIVIDDEDRSTVIRCCMSDSVDATPQFLRITEKESTMQAHIRASF